MGLPSLRSPWRAAIDSGFGLLHGEVMYLSATPVAIDMTLAGLFWAMGGEEILAKWIRKTLYVGAFAYIVLIVGLRERFVMATRHRFISRFLLGCSGNGGLALFGKGCMLGFITTFLRSVMDKFISAAEATRQFSALLRDVREGCQYVVTSHGRPIARLVPISKDGDVAMSGRAALLSRLEGQPVCDVGRWTREELYESDQ